MQYMYQYLILIDDTEMMSKIPSNQWRPVHIESLRWRVKILQLHMYFHTRMAFHSCSL